MKAITRIPFSFAAGCVCASLLFLFSTKALAIEGLAIAVPSTNVVLSWPSDSSETYIVQYRHTLDATDSWSTLADYYPPDSGTNITFYTDINPVDFGSGGSGGGGGSFMMGSMMGGSSEPMTWEEIIAMLMPPMPSTENTLSSSRNFGNPTPMDEDSDSSTAIAGTGFYRVVRNGVHLVGITNDMVLSGVVQIPVELGNANGYLSSLSILEDNSPIGNSSQDYPIQNPQTITLDTTILPNGVHLIQGNATWQDTNGGLWEADAPTISVTVSNEISFENWFSTFGETGDTFLFRATSAHPVTDWNVYVYNYTNGYLGYFSGHTDDGDISFYYDYSGTSLTNNPKFSFEVETEYIDPPSPPTYKKADPWPTTGRWAAAIQHAWDDSLDTDSLYQQLNGFVGFGSTHGGIYPPASADGSPYALAYGAGNPQGDTDWAVFRTNLFHPNTRNLIYFGHGDQNGIGSGANTNRYISAKEIATRLHTIPAGQTNQHSFRFVFIDACSTGVGMMPESFGIKHKENVPAGDYIAASTRFSAYVGWPKDKMIGLVNGRYPNYDHVHFMQWIQYEMLTGRGVKDAINHACHYPDVHDFGENDMKVFGYWDLTIGSYNN